MSTPTKMALLGGLLALAHAADVQSTSLEPATSKTVAAETHVVSAYWPDIADGDVEASVIAANPTATTYLVCEEDLDGQPCGYNYTVVAGPSTAAIHMTISDAYFADVECTLTITASQADCSAHNSVDGTEVHTSTVLSNLDEFRSEITVTAGYEKLAAETGSSDKPKETGKSNDDKDNDNDDNDDGNDGDDGDNNNNSNNNNSDSDSSNDDGDDRDGAAAGLFPGAMVAGAVALVGSMLLL